jgi:Ca-activated chloride channel homolog
MMAGLEFRRFRDGFLFLCAVIGITLYSGVARSDELGRCQQDAMIIFDASGSMSGMLRTGVRESRIDRVRDALRDVLPQIEETRNLGLIVYGPGERSNSCRNVDLRFSPRPNAAARIINEVNALVPSGDTPLTDAVRSAAEVLNFRDRDGVIVLFTDGEETCGGQTCRLARWLRTEAANLTVHVVDYTIRDPYGNRKGFKSHCLVNETGGIYVPAQTKAELIAAFRKTLGCPMLAESLVD